MVSAVLVVILQRVAEGSPAGQEGQQAQPDGVEAEHQPAVGDDEVVVHDRAGHRELGQHLQPA
jgi:hypothetical protein